MGEVVLLSLQVASVGTLVALLVATPLALWLARGRSVLRSIVEVVALLPLVLPPVVVGYGLLVGLGGLGLSFTWWGAALAAGVMGFPLLLRGLREAIAAVDPGLELAAASLGARPLAVRLRVTLPLALPGAIAGCALCFARCLGEFGATMTFAGNIAGVTRTLPLAIYTELQSPDGERQAWVLCGVSVVLAVAATVLSEVLVRRARARSREEAGP